MYLTPQIFKNSHCRRRNPSINRRPADCWIGLPISLQSHLQHTWASGVSLGLRFTSVGQFPAKSTLTTAPTNSPSDGEFINIVVVKKRRECELFWYILRFHLTENNYLFLPDHARAEQCREVIWHPSWATPLFPLFINTNNLRMGGSLKKSLWVVIFHI